MSDRSAPTRPDPPEPVNVSIADLSVPQRDLLLMHLRGDEVPYVFDGESISVPGDRGDELLDALRWIADELAPMEPPVITVEVPHPFRREHEEGWMIASRWRRFAGWVLDGMFLSFAYVVGRGLELSGWTAYAVLSAAIVVLTRLVGGTPGKLLLGLRVAHEDGGTVTWLGAVLRWAVPATLPVAGALVVSNLPSAVALWVLQLLIFVPILWDGYGQGLHDRVAQTIVVQGTRGPLRPA